MNMLSFPLVSWVYRTIMIGVFVAVVVGLVLAVSLLKKTDQKLK